MPARVGRRTSGRDIQRLDRDLDRPARVPAVAQGFQGETGPVECGSLLQASRDLALGYRRVGKPLWHAFAHLTLIRQRIYATYNQKTIHTDAAQAHAKHALRRSKSLSGERLRECVNAAHGYYAAYERCKTFATRRRNAERR